MISQTLSSSWSIGRVIDPRSSCFLSRWERVGVRAFCRVDFPPHTRQVKAKVAPGAGFYPFPPCGGRSGWGDRTCSLHPHPHPPPSKGEGKRGHRCCDPPYLGAYALSPTGARGSWESCQGILDRCSRNPPGPQSCHRRRGSAAPRERCFRAEPPASRQRPGADRPAPPPPCVVHQ